MNSKVVLLVPEAPAPAAAAIADQPQARKTEVRLGLLDNSKANADHLLRFVMEALRAELPVKSITATRKDNVSLPAPREVLDRLAAECDFVVTAMAD